MPPECIGATIYSVFNSFRGGFTILIRSMAFVFAAAALLALPCGAHACPDHAAVVQAVSASWQGEPAPVGSRASRHEEAVRAECSASAHEAPCTVRAAPSPPSTRPRPMQPRSASRSSRAAWPFSSRRSSHGAPGSTPFRPSPTWPRAFRSSTSAFSRRPRRPQQDGRLEGTLGRRGDGRLSRPLPRRHGLRDVRSRAVRLAGFGRHAHDARRSRDA